MLVLWALYSKLSDHQNLRAFGEFVQTLDLFTLFWVMTLVVMLMLINWGIEVIKWQIVCKPFHQWAWKDALSSVFCGLSWAVFTPNRLGEYGGRVFFLPPRKRLLGVVAMGFGAFAQLAITQCTGALALAWFLDTYFSLPPWVENALWVLACLYGLFFLFVFAKLSSAYHWLPEWKRLKRLKRYLRILRRFKRKTVGAIMTWSMLRFLIFTSQYLLLFMVFLPEISWTTTYGLVVLLLFVQTVLPSLDLFDFGVRSLTGGYIFSFVTDQEMLVMAIVSCIWFINLIVPAIIGAPLVFKIKFFGNSDH